MQVNQDLINNASCYTKGEGRCIEPINKSKRDKWDKYFDLPIHMYKRFITPTTVIIVKLSTNSTRRLLRKRKYT